ncbi:ATP-binding protein [Lysinibacillus xylanilyticus]|nr:ATP-binding protein [Lysinibacillus xylanilyticus]
MVKVGLFGPQGAGKTTLGMLLCRLVQSMDSRIKIYTNVTNIDENDETVVTISDLAEIPFQDGLPKIVYVDEAYFSVGSRTSSSKQNVVWTKAFALFRKSDVILTIFATHRPNMVDVNIRNLLEYVIMGRKNKGNLDYIVYDVISKEWAPLQLEKNKKLFDFTRFNTKDFPNTIATEELQKLPIFGAIK